MTCRKLLRSSTRRCFPRTGKFRLVLETIWTYEVVSSERCESRYSLALGFQPERLDPGNETNLWNSKSLAKTARRIEASGAYLDSRRYPTMNLLYDILSLRPDILSLSLSRSRLRSLSSAPLAPSRRVPTTLQLYRQNYGIRLEDPASRPEGALLRGHVLSPGREKFPPRDSGGETRHRGSNVVWLRVTCK